MAIGYLKMKIEKIKIQNFYSFKDVVLDMRDYSGLTLIKGKIKTLEGLTDLARVLW